MTAVEAQGRRSISIWARGRRYLPLLKRRLAQFQPAALETAMLRPARRRDVIECYRIILGREPESATAIDGHLRTRPLLRDVIATFTQSSEVRVKHMRSNLAFDRVQEPDYLAKSFGGIERVRAYYGHYGFLADALSGPALHALLAGGAVLHVQHAEHSEYRVLLTATHERHEEGELQLQIHDGRSVLYVMGLTIVPGELCGVVERRVMLISRLQGVPGAFLAIRQATKAFGEIQPRAVLLAAAEGLAAGLGLDTIVAVAADNQLAADKCQTETLAKSYDEFFTAAGAERWGKAFFRLDLARERQSPAAASRSHAKRAERRRRLRQEISALAAGETRCWLNSPSHPAASAEADHAVMADLLFREELRVPLLQSGTG